jgi:hypothetical protein
MATVGLLRNPLCVRRLTWRGHTLVIRVVVRRRQVPHSEFTALPDPDCFGRIVQWANLGAAFLWRTIRTENTQTTCAQVARRKTFADKKKLRTMNSTNTNSAAQNSAAVNTNKKGSTVIQVIRILLLTPILIALWPFTRAWKFVNRNFLSYVMGRVVKDKKRIYSIRFIWYGDSIYLHPMIWGSLIMYALTTAGIITAGWALLSWFVLLFLCYVTILYNFDIIRCSILGVGVVAFFGVAYFATVEWAWNPLTVLADHVRWLDASVSPGFFVASAYVFLSLIFSEIVWAWLFHRVEIDESYVYEHQFLKVSTREPIFARGLKRETRDILELILLGAGDIQHRTRSGYKCFKNVPFASLWLGRAIDRLLDFRRKAEVDIEQASTSGDGESVRPSDANPELNEELFEEGDDIEDDDTDGDDMDDGAE